MNTGLLKTAMAAGAILAMVGCSATDPTTLQIVDEDRTIPGGEIPGTRLTEGVTIQVDGTELIVRGDLIVEDGAVLRGLQNPLVLVVEGDLTVDGEISADGHLAIVSDAAMAPDLDALRLDDDSIPNGLDLQPADDDAPIPARQWMVRGPLAPGQDGENGARLHLDMHGNLNLQPEEPGETLNINVPDGDQGEDQNGCGVTGGNGGKGGSLNITVRGGRIRLDSVSFTGGNGGMGGYAIGSSCVTGSRNTGGDGGESGSFRLAARLAQSFDVRGTISFNGFSAGSGGMASISGQDDEPGAHVEANGGVGEDVQGRSLTVSAGIGYDGSSNIVMNIGSAGDGGDTDSTGGNGLEGVCDAASGVASPSFDGGTATSVGGKGGSVDVSVNVAAGAPVSTADGFESGDGGYALAYGGRGGDGKDCAVLGGDGGHGAQATTNGGDGGTSNQGANGSSGQEDAFGGQGGHGGDAEDQGGRGGDGGFAIGANSNGGSGGDGGDAAMIGGDGGNGGCVGGQGGAGGAAPIPGIPGQNC